jgi:branched-chain amino acid aminotransferase
MPCTIRQLTTNGLQPVNYQAESLADAVPYEPDDGVYTVANTENTYGVIKLTAHLDRLADSARRAGIPFTLSHQQIRDALRQVIDLAGYGNVKFRITVPRQNPDQIIVSVEPFAGYPASLYTEGMRVATAPNSARHNPAAKATDWMHQREALRAGLKEGVSDVILLNAEGDMLEATSANFYAIFNDTLYTAQDGVLGGTSRQIVYEIAPAILPLVRRPLNVHDVPLLQEAFITSSSRGIVPVVEIDAHAIGDGKPGKWTQALRTAYVDWMQAHLEIL